MNKVGRLNSSRAMHRFRNGIVIAIAMVLAIPAFSDEKVKGGGRYDAQITETVREKLGKKSEFKDVKVTTEDGIVTMEGTVKLYIDKLNAENRARKVDKVAGVRNWIEVADAGVTDTELTETLSRKLRYDRIGQGVVFNNFGLRVEGGTVTIAGNVRDYPDRASALAIVNTTAGVRDVIDEIEVAKPSGFDDELRIRTAYAIYGHPTMTKYAMNPMAPIRINVEDGHVTLYGAVDSEGDKTVAVVQAKSVPGAFSVTDRLLVADKVVR